MAALQPRRRLDDAGLGCSPFARRYWGNHCCFLFLQVLRCFSSLRVPRQHTCAPVPRLQRGGLSHSETRGSTVTCTYPRIIAACRVLHRQREPRHPPYALKCFLSRTAPTPRNRGTEAAAGFRWMYSPGHGRPVSFSFTLLRAGRSRAAPARRMRKAWAEKGTAGRPACVTTCQWTTASPLCTPREGGGGERVENIGFEPMTPCLQSRCSSQLS